MFKQCFDDMFKYKNYTWFAHNLGGFDAIFIIQTLFKNYNLPKIHIKDGKVLSIKVSKTNFNIKNNKKETNTLTFKDSYKFMPMALSKLIKDFDISVNKLLFPYKFMNINNLNYDGVLPDKSFYNNITEIDYKKLVEVYKDKNWNLKTELLIYMKNDIVALYKIIDIYIKYIFDLENLNITKVSTISSVSLISYLSNYYNIKTPIYIPRHKNYLDIKNCYYGGRVEVYKPYAEKIFIYDVVSLYPSVMLKDLPIGYLNKSTDTNLDNYLGFVMLRLMYLKAL